MLQRSAYSSLNLHIGDTWFECILVDFGLVSGEGLPVSHAERRNQFTLSDEEDVGKIHPLENTRLSSEQLRCIDILCLCVSLTKTVQCHRSRDFRAWCQYVFHVISRRGRNYLQKLADIYAHPFVRRYACKSTTPGKIVHIGRVTSLGIRPELPKQSSVPTTANDS